MTRKQTDPPRIVTQAAQLVHLAEGAYRFGMSTEGGPFAVAIEGPNLARPFRGRSGFRADLARRFNIVHGKPPGQAALAEALLVLEGVAQVAEVTDTPLRVGTFSGSASVWVDLGWSDGMAVRLNCEPPPAHAHIDPWKSWRMEPALVTFRRSALTAPHRQPVYATWESVGLLDRHLPVTDEDLRLVVAWCVAVLILVEAPVPILAARGEQGSGKSTLSRRLVELLDPSPAPNRARPKDLGEWIVAAAGSRLVGLDNMSFVPWWLSDAMCRAVTGEGMVARQLYTDGDLHVVRFRRALIVNGIDLGRLQPDLANRMLTVELDSLDESRIRHERALDDAWAEELPLILGGLYDLAGHVLRVLPGVRLERHPRMADFARVVAAVDEVTGWDTFARYLGTVERLVLDGIDDNQVAAAIVDLLDLHGTWTGKTAELLTEIRPEKPDEDFPKTVQGLAGELRRIVPTLRRAGIDLAWSKPDRTHRRTITLTLQGTESECAMSADPAPSAHIAHSAHSNSLPFTGDPSWNGQDPAGDEWDDDDVEKWADYGVDP